MSKSPASETSFSSASVASDEEVIARVERKLPFIPNVGILQSLKAQEAKDEETIVRMERALEGESLADRVAEGVRAGLNGFIGQIPSRARVEQVLKDLLHETSFPARNVSVRQNADDLTVFDITMDVPVFNYIHKKVTL